MGNKRSEVIDQHHATETDTGHSTTFDSRDPSRPITLNIKLNRDTHPCNCDFP